MNRALPGLLVAAFLLAACATAPVTSPPQGLFNDQLFRAPSERISADDIFAVSPDMKHYLETEIAVQIRIKGAQQALYDALYAKRQLVLDYDAEKTRNAAEAFAARSGNCLSLVIMTAAFAKELGLPVRYQSAYADETWSRERDAYFFIGHVNISLGRRPEFGFGNRGVDHMTIDFIPPLEMRALRTQDVEERTIVAMYMNNRAAETLIEGQLDDAYAWARAAIAQDPGFVNGYNTLGIIYQRHGNLVEAEKALSYALAQDSANTRVMSNLAAVLSALGRAAESAALSRRLEQIEPDPPFSYFNEGKIALQNGDFTAARDLFIREINRAPYYHEFHFWLAVAYLGLGEVEQARRQLSVAMEYSTTRKERELYATKLDRIKSSRTE
ncbi:MAG TPA: tetratricopeptide repeat protein [Casimicrobiaceae bacterium]|nr:tetratricopeptide repeat protein [Casimicrobiaceae bacterium]